MSTSFWLAEEAASFSMLSLTTAQAANINAIMHAMSRAFAEGAAQPGTALFGDAPGRAMLLRSDEVHRAPCSAQASGHILIPTGAGQEGSS